MGQISAKIMGMPMMSFDVDDGDELGLKGAVEFTNIKYNEVQKQYSNVGDSNKHRALTILSIVTELLAIKGEQEVFLDKNTKKVNDLIKMVDKLGLPD